MMNVPIVRLELEGMRQSILHAFADFQREQSAAVRLKLLMGEDVDHD
jgi:hypothetical protein